MAKKGNFCDITVNGETAHRILRLCPAAGVPLNALGICAHIPRGRAREILEGAEPTRTELRRLADALGVEPEDIQAVQGCCATGKGGRDIC